MNNDAALRTAKQDVEALLRTLPDDATLEDIYVLEKVRAGQADVDAGRVLDGKQARDRLAKWLT